MESAKENARARVFYGKAFVDSFRSKQAQVSVTRLKGGRQAYIRVSNKQSTAPVYRQTRASTDDRGFQG